MISPQNRSNVRLVREERASISALEVLHGLEVFLGQVQISFKDLINRAKFWVAIGFMTAVSIVVMIGTIYFVLAIYAKRWHDRNKLGQWSLIALATVIGAIWIFIELNILVGPRVGSPANTDRIRLPEKSQLFWLFFRFSGRVNRAAYLLGFLFMLVVMSFPLYQFMRVYPESVAAEVWSMLFGLASLIFLWTHIAFSVKRLHDFDKPGLFAVALFIPVISVFAFIALCLFPGTQGPNQFGNYTNSSK